MAQDAPPEPRYRMELLQADKALDIAVGRINADQDGNPIDPAELVELGEHYARTVGHPIQYQWTLLAGVNDSDEEMDGIVRLLSGKHAMMNLIPWNTVDELGYSRPSAERAAEMSRALNRRGILTRLRQSAGQDVQAGCGQLRSRAGQAARRPAPEQPITLHR